MLIYLLVLIVLLAIVFYLGRRYERGQGTGILDQESALNFFWKRAEKGDSGMCLELARTLFKTAIKFVEMAKKKVHDEEHSTELRLLEIKDLSTDIEKEFEKLTQLNEK